MLSKAGSIACRHDCIVLNSFNGMSANETTTKG